DHLCVLASNYCISPRRCFKGNVYSVRAESVGSTGNREALLVSTSQDITINGGYYYANGDHATDTGGGHGVAGVVNRNIIFKGVTSFGFAYSASFHGNSEFCGYVGGILEGIIIGGASNYVDGPICFAEGSSFQSLIRGTEWKNTAHSFKNIKAYLRTTTDLSEYRIFDFGQLGIINSDTDAGGMIVVEDNEVEIHSDATTVRALTVQNAGSAATDISCSWRNNTIKHTGSSQLIPIVSAVISGADLADLVDDGNTY